MNSPNPVPADKTGMASTGAVATQSAVATALVVAAAEYLAEKVGVKIDMTDPTTIMVVSGIATSASGFVHTLLRKYVHS